MAENPKIVYAIKHNKTGRIYVGSSERASWRVKDHLNKLRRGSHENELMQQDFDKHGEDYSFYQLDVIPCQQKSNREYFWMMALGTFYEDKGYNYKDPMSKRYKIESFPKLEMENTEPVINRDILTCFQKTAQWLGVSMDELMTMKKPKELTEGTIKED